MGEHIDVGDRTVGSPKVRLPLAHGLCFDAHPQAKGGLSCPLRLTAGDINVGEDISRPLLSTILPLGWKSVQSALNPYWLAGESGRTFLPQGLRGHVLRQPLASALKLGCPGRA